MKVVRAIEEANTPTLLFNAAPRNKPRRGEKSLFRGENLRYDLAPEQPMTVLQTFFLMYVADT